MTQDSLPRLLNVASLLPLPGKDNPVPWGALSTLI
jgi:hypothetical protein